ncbi:MAG TPA: hypothetical protein VMB48_12675 [Steroidobacteraceae bacterium]|nr:hypothetical protein [Steroidobacteraceae bacterium]
MALQPVTLAQYHLRNLDIPESAADRDTGASPRDDADDGLRAARGITFGLLIGVAFWAWVFVLVLSRR